MSSQSPNEESPTGTGVDGNQGNNNSNNIDNMGQGDGEKGGTRLTEEEKKQNHIASEQKRRTAIREGFDRLASIVPGIENQARSEALVLRKTVDYMVEKLQDRRRLIQACDDRGIYVDPSLRNEVQRLQLFEEYRNNKVYKGDSSEASSDDKKLGPGPKKKTTSASR